MQDFDTVDATGRVQISHRVMRNFLHGIRWQPSDYLAADVTPAPAWERELDSLEGCKRLADSVAHQPHSSEGLLSLALMLDQRGGRLEVLRPLLRAGVQSEYSMARLLLARALLREGQHAEAITELMGAVTVDPGFNDVHRAVGLVYRQLGKLDDAALHLGVSLSLPRRLRMEAAAKRAVLVYRPNAQFEIYGYRQNFYVAPSESNSAGVLAIAGELYTARKNLSYRLAHRLYHTRYGHWLRSALRASKKPKEQAASALPVHSGFRSSYRAILRNLAKRALQRTALVFFARPIVRRTTSLREALELAGSGKSSL